VSRGDANNQKARTRVVSVKASRAAASDELYPDAVQIVRNWGHADTSILQKRLRISYSRAYHLIERMQRERIVNSDFLPVKP